MSGFAFQKLNGGLTTANKQLKELEEINKDLDDVIEGIELLGKTIDKPEVWKMARMYAPDKPLTPIQWSWSATAHDHKQNQTFSDGKMYYGLLQASLRVTNLDRNTGRHGASLDVWNNGSLQANYMAMYKGDNGIDMSSEVVHFMGFFTDLVLQKHHSYSFEAFATVEFQGFELGDRDTELPSEPTDFNVIVDSVKENSWVHASYFVDITTPYESWPLDAGVNPVPNKITNIYSKHPFTAYQGDNIPLFPYQQTGGSWVLELPVSPLNRDVYVFFEEHSLPYLVSTGNESFSFMSSLRNVTFSFQQFDISHSPVGSIIHSSQKVVTEHVTSSRTAFIGVKKGLEVRADNQKMYIHGVRLKDSVEYSLYSLKDIVNKKLLIYNDLFEVVNKCSFAVPHELKKDGLDKQSYSSAGADMNFPSDYANSIRFSTTVSASCVISICGLVFRTFDIVSGLTVDIPKDFGVSITFNPKS